MPPDNLPLRAPSRRADPASSPRDPARARALRELRAGLTSRPRTLPSKYFYDAAGSALFERITALPEYYLTRAEDALLRRRAPEIAASTEAQELVELGAGAATKTRRLLDALREQGTLQRYVPVDVDATMIARVEQDLAVLYPGLRVDGVAADFIAEPLKMPGLGWRLVALLGSTLGNFAGSQATQLLSALRPVMGPNGRLLLGVDLVKDEAVLHAAYNDAAGVTAAFNRNLLRVVNRRFGANFDPDAFAHLASWNRRARRVEMHLVSREAQKVEIASLGLTLSLRKGERLRTEVSCKYTRRSLQRLLGRAGLTIQRWMPAEDGSFALALIARV
ncbi:MAG TPA: L-histidine N(alpha)-methyltransferase [Candidatus Polarisedimenticolaceae bacterium]|nr:L-histidine N(alpha)-methyltransferase [Candidatus Polarisedimenticolaceae bacterium]